MQATVDDVLDQMEYAISLVGADHVGIGTDSQITMPGRWRFRLDSSIRWYRTMRPDVFGVGPTDRYDPFLKAWIATL